MLPQTRTGTVRIYTPNMVFYAGNIYTPIAALAELFANSLDAGATHIMGYIDAQRVLVVDNGQGMVPLMTPEDRQLLEDLHRGVTKDIDELRSKLSVSSLHSLEWMAENIGLSEKLVRDDPNARGVKAVGTLAFLSFADSQTVSSKPDIYLAQHFYGTDLRDHTQIPTARLILPSADQLKSGNISYQINSLDVSEELRDQWNKVLKQGTVVEVTHLRIPAIEALRPLVVAEYLGKAFDDELNSGIQMEIIDHVTKEGLAIRGGKIITVQPPSFRTPPIIDEEAKTNKGEVFHIKLHVDLSARGQVPQLKRLGKSVDLTSLNEFKDRYPWNTGFVLGSIHYPRLSQYEELHGWDLAKGTPTVSPRRTRWAQAVTSYEPIISARIDEIRQRASDSSTKHLGEALTDAIVEATKEMPVFGEKDILVAKPEEDEPKPKKKKKGDKGKVKKIPTYIRIGVINENAEGVPGVTIRLLSANDNPREALTGISGHVSFRNLKDGRYVTQMVLPVGTYQKKTDTSHDFVIHHERRPGGSYVFHIVDGRERQTKSKLAEAKVSVIFLPLPDPLEPWQHRFEEKQPVLIINTEGQEFRDALDQRNFATVRFLLSNFAAGGLTDGFFEGPKRMVLQYENRLAACIERHMGSAVDANLRKLAAKAR